MRKFFKPLRTKFGVVTLAIACLFLAGWIVSYWGAFLVEFNHFWPSYGLISSFDGFSITRIGLVTAEQHIIDSERIRTSILITDDLPLEFSRGDARIMRFRSDHAEFYSESADGTLTKLTLVPFWSIVVPLTLLSAYLLFSKPRPTSTQSVPHA